MMGWLCGLLGVQFVVILVHDWVDVPGLQYGRQVRAEVGSGKMAAATAVNAVFPGLAFGLAWAYRGGGANGWVKGYWILYTGVTVLSAAWMWWVPYFKGTDEKTTGMYERMYRGTWHVLPARGEGGRNPRPNVLHLAFHALFLATLGLAVGVRVG